MFACAANGTLNVFKKFLNGTKAISKPLFDATEDEILSFEKDCWANYQVKMKKVLLFFLNISMFL